MLTLLDTLKTKSFSQKICFIHKDICTDPETKKNVFKDSIALKAFHRW